MTHTLAESATFRMLAIVGSLRRGSYNRMLLRAAHELTPVGVTIEDFDIRPIPFYDGDVEEAGIPAPVEVLKARIRAADAVLFISPEYNHSVPGVLKNALDWVARPPTDNPLKHKSVGLMGATIGGVGTERGQLAMRQVLQYTESLVMPRPELLVSFAHQRFDADGHLHHEPTRGFVRTFLQALVEWTGYWQPPSR